MYAHDPLNPGFGYILNIDGIPYELTDAQAWNLLISIKGIAELLLK